MQNKKTDKKLKLASMKYFVLKHKNGKPDTKHCCDYCCMHEYKCGEIITSGDETEAMTWFRCHLHTFSAIQLRRFISARLTPRNKALNIKQNQYVLENIEIIKYYYSHNYVSILPACLNKDMLLVCSNFFRWAIGVSKNKIDQPSLHAADPSFEGYSINMGGPRQIVYYQHDCADKIVAWLRTLAANSFQDPASDKIILSFGTKKLVYDQYQADFDEESCAKYFSRQSNGEILLPSLNYFLKTWKNRPEVNHIKIRKWMPHAKCVTCVAFVARRNMALSEADKLALQVEIKLHRNFIHRENEAYYVRRQQAISHPEKFLSCSLDAATQAVFLLPHWAVEDKDVSACKRIPMHLMGCLCHGRNAYCYAFTDNIKHGANALIEILHRVLFHEWQQTRSLPPTFYVLSYQKTEL